jgi:NADP-dependent 3-hydroxy acid dehydrogenase YdfG
MENWHGKVAFITGGASGIGLGIAQAFVGAGMKVIIADLRQDHLDEALKGFEAQGKLSSVHAIRLDVTDREAYARAAIEVVRVFGKVHLLFNNAGVALMGPVKEMKYADWDWGLGVMIGGVVNGVQTLLPRILEHGEGGHICSTSSISGLLPINGTAVYSTAKASLVAMAEAMRGELAGDNVGVSVFCPGPVYTNIRETGRLRPDRYRDSNFIEAEKQLEESARSSNWMSIDECGERVLAGIKRNDLYIFTHREFKDPLGLKCKAMMNAFPDEEVNLARSSEIGFLLHNPIFADAAARRPES